MRRRAILAGGAVVIVLAGVAYLASPGRAGPIWS